MMDQLSGSSISSFRSHTKHVHDFQLPVASRAASSSVISPIMLIGFLRGGGDVVLRAFSRCSPSSLRVDRLGAVRRTRLSGRLPASAFLPLRNEERRQPRSDCRLYQQSLSHLSGVL